MVIVIQYNECASCYQIVSLNLVKIVNFMLCIFGHSKKKKKNMHRNKASESLCIIKLDARCNLQGLIEIMECGRVSQEPPLSPDLRLHRSES